MSELRLEAGEQHTATEHFSLHQSCRTTSNNTQSMPIFSIEQREQWQTVVTYSVEAETEHEAQELTRTGTLNYENHEILNRDFVKFLDIHETHIH
jgi:hypothetical protein